MKKSDIILGAKYKDVVTGAQGTAVALTTYLSGCDRIAIQPPLDKDGKVPEWQYCDIVQVKRVGRTQVIVAIEEPEDNGGPRPTPRGRPDPR